MMYFHYLLHHIIKKEIIMIEITFKAINIIHKTNKDLLSIFGVIKQIAVVNNKNAINVIRQATIVANFSECSKAKS